MASAFALVLNVRNPSRDAAMTVATADDHDEPRMRIALVKL